MRLTLQRFVLHLDKVKTYKTTGGGGDQDKYLDEPGGTIRALLKEGLGFDVAIPDTLALYLTTLSALVASTVADRSSGGRCRLAELHEFLESVATLCQAPEGLDNLNAYYRVVYRDHKAAATAAAKRSVRADLLYPVYIF